MPTSCCISGVTTQRLLDTPGSLSSFFQTHPRRTQHPPSIFCPLPATSLSLPRFVSRARRSTCRRSLDYSITRPIAASALRIWTSCWLLLLSRQPVMSTPFAGLLTQPLFADVSLEIQLVLQARITQAMGLGDDSATGVALLRFYAYLIRHYYAHYVKRNSIAISEIWTPSCLDPQERTA